MHNDTLKAALMYFKHFFNENNFAIDKRETAKSMKSFLIVDWINFWTSDDGIASRSLLIVDFFFIGKNTCLKKCEKYEYKLLEGRAGVSSPMNQGSRYESLSEVFKCTPCSIRNLNYKWCIMQLAFISTFK